MATPNAAIAERLPGLHTRVVLNRPRRPDGVVTDAPCSLVGNADSIMRGPETVNSLQYWLFKVEQLRNMRNALAVVHKGVFKPAPTVEEFTQ
jgi:hypothetical protein